MQFNYFSQVTMNQKPSSAKGANASQNRPSLYIAMPTQGTTEKQGSILGGLEPERAASRFLYKSMAIAVLIGLLAMAWLATKRDGPMQLDWLRASLPVAGKTTLAAVPASSGKTEAQQPVTQSAALPALKEPAVIVVENTVSEAQQTAPGLTQPEANASAQPTVLVSNSESSTVGINPQVNQVGDSKTENQLVLLKSNTVAKPSAKSASPKKAAKVARAAPAVKAKQDSDVDLIAALLTRIGPAADAKGRQANAKVAVRNNTVATRTPLSRKDKNRDVVVGIPTESTESLVKRCRTLGFFEGELCRIRICSGLWGSDPACPAAAHASNLPQ